MGFGWLRDIFKYCYMKKDTCIVIGTYPTTYLDSALLGLTIESWKQQGYDICLVSHFPVNQDLQKASKYYIYSDENEMLEFPTISNISWYHANSDFLYQTNWGNTLGKHSYAVLQNIKNAIHFLSSKKYTHFFFVEADGFLNSEDHFKFEKELEDADFLNKDYWFMMEYEGATTLPVTNFFGGKLDYFVKRFSVVKDTDSYLSLSAGGGGYSLESLFGELFIRLQQGDGVVKHANPRNFFTSEWFGVSSGGEVRVPGLKSKDWWIDLVQEKGSQEIMYMIVSHSSSVFNTVLKLFKNNVEVFSTPFQTGPLAWFKTQIEPDCTYRLEHWIGGQLTKHIEYTSEQILENNWSFMEFH